MRRRISSKKQILLVLFLLVLINIPQARVEELRSVAVATLIPLRIVAELPHQVSDLLSLETTKGQEERAVSHEAFQKLEWENQQLKLEVNRWRELFQHELHLLSQLSALSHLSDGLEQAGKRHKKQMEQVISEQVQALTAQVIFRSPLSWSSSLWINVGEADNRDGEAPKIGKNSPVLSGHSIVGVVDYVGKYQSRVRLISDSGLTIAVRAARGDPQYRFLTEQLQLAIGLLSVRPELFESKQEKQAVINQLERLKERLERVSAAKDLLAKGELHGSSAPLWRQPGELLEGIGFNYDFSDEEGPPRDLRTGKPMDNSSRESLPLLKMHDLLITTGLDGVFPAGLPVAEVVKIRLLKEGDFTYSLEAKPTAGDLQQLSLLYVLPPGGFNSEDQPTPLRRASI